MISKDEEIKKLLGQIFDKLQRLEQKIEKQEGDVRIFLAGRDTNYALDKINLA
ncbi:MAG: hypothetical protein LF888_00270 [Candidatus Megaira endosymbiont of Mesostigma viride]|nr:MAG: hypothetical protein LF888_00270 [Candidatus Megaira endosymbiont of Mesostigma viride]HJK88209.1 hypothetical protein [Candidatus Megaira endosymbiont of Mesostigma viride]